MIKWRSKLWLKAASLAVAGVFLLYGANIPLARADDNEMIMTFEDYHDVMPATPDVNFDPVQEAASVPASESSQNQEEASVPASESSQNQEEASVPASESSQNSHSSINTGGAYGESGAYIDPDTGGTLIVTNTLNSDGSVTKTFDRDGDVTTYNISVSDLPAAAPTPATPYDQTTGGVFGESGTYSDPDTGARVIVTNINNGNGTVTKTIDRGNGDVSTYVIPLSAIPESASINNTYRNDNKTTAPTPALGSPLTPDSTSAAPGPNSYLMVDYVNGGIKGVYDPDTNKTFPYIDKPIERTILGTKPIQFPGAVIC